MEAQQKALEKPEREHQEEELLKKMEEAFRGLRPAHVRFLLKDKTDEQKQKIFLTLFQQTQGISFLLASFIKEDGLGRLITTEMILAGARRSKRTARRLVKLTTQQTRLEVLKETNPRAIKEVFRLLKKDTERFSKIIQQEVWNCLEKARKEKNQKIIRGAAPLLLNHKEEVLQDKDAFNLIVECLLSVEKFNKKIVFLLQAIYQSRHRWLIKHLPKITEKLLKIPTKLTTDFLEDIINRYSKILTPLDEHLFESILQRNSDSLCRAFGKKAERRSLWPILKRQLGVEGTDKQKQILNVLSGFVLCELSLNEWGDVLNTIAESVARKENAWMDELAAVLAEAAPRGKKWLRLLVESFLPEEIDERKTFFFSKVILALLDKVDDIELPERALSRQWNAWLELTQKHCGETNKLIFDALVGLAKTVTQNTLEKHYTRMRERLLRETSKDARRGLAMLTASVGPDLWQTLCKRISEIIREGEAKKEMLLLCAELYNYIGAPFTRTLPEIIMVVSELIEEESEELETPLQTTIGAIENALGHSLEKYLSK